MENNFDIHKWQAKYLREESSPANTLQKCIDDLEEQIQYAILDGLEEYSNAYYTLEQLVRRWREELQQLQEQY